MSEVPLQGSGLMVKDSLGCTAQGSAGVHWPGVLYAVQVMDCGSEFKV